MIFEDHVFELKNNDKTKICCYCGKPVNKEQIVLIDQETAIEKYSCNCSDWANNTKDLFKKEMAYCKEKKIIKSLEAVYDPSIHGGRANYFLYCVLISQGQTQEAAKLLKKHT